MKTKINLFLVTILVSVSVFAQKKTMSKVEQDASNTMQFSNSVINLRNYNISNLDNFENIPGTAAENIRKIGRYSESQLLAINCPTPIATIREQVAYNAEVKKGYTFSEKKEMVDLVKQAQQDTKLLENQCKNINEYFTQKKFKTNTDFSEYSVMKDSLEYYVSKVAKSWNEASDVASKAGDRAEIVLLKGSKIADFVIPMKTDLARINNILNDFGKENKDFTEIKEQNKMLLTSIQTNKDINTKDTSKLSDVYYKEVYQNFYRACTTIQSNIEKLIERVESQDYESANSFYGYINSEYNKAIESYNLFIKQ